MLVPTTPNSAPPPKQMSSRLMTMKFMQRASAVRSSESQTPASEPPSKRRRLETMSGASTPGKTSDSDANASPLPGQTTQTPLRTRSIREGNETEWVLNVAYSAKAQSRANGHLQADGRDDEIWSNTPTGRQTYGSFKRKKDTAAPASADKDDGELSSASESIDSEDDYNRGKLAAKARPGSAQHQLTNKYGSPLTRLPNSKDRRKQNRTPKKTARKTM